jgi:hypothetical protein
MSNLIDIVNPQPTTEYGLWLRELEHNRAKFQVFNRKRKIINVEVK